ncbi:TraB/GumN family protein [Massilia sp. IC2-278]|uniref:TraB/GumN family protein n=1 Tax=Massilia sp. IC2-278 TaxID=2887200 RepID=UPI001E3B2F51|nr:TraB/GumN family protein [Massilia sp. IC2-278]MCC2962771.1 TraB/GumN family protein [Massilia sp. IC2-278]
MFTRALSALTLCFLTLPALAQTAPAADPPTPVADTAPADAAGEPLPQTILVSGSRPGPGLWKVSKGDHVMWVFGAYDALPKSIEWRSKDAERKIAQSQEYLGGPGMGVGVGWGGIAALPFMVGFKKNPDGVTLRDLLSPDLYARWAPLKQKYFANDDDIERERPVFVAQELYRRAMVEAGLARGTEPREVLGKLAKKHNVKYTETTVRIQVKEPVRTVREFKKTVMEDVPCLAATMSSLETDVEAIRVRANAWAVGELDAIEKLNFDERETACTNAFLSSAITRLQPEILTAKARSMDNWMAAAEKALENNTSTFSVLSMKEVLSPQGALAKLKAKGYTVEKPN